jgi:hypothetical protein
MENKKFVEIEETWGFRAECPFCGMVAPAWEGDPRCPHYRGGKPGNSWGRSIYVFEETDPQPEPAPEPQRGTEVREIRVIHYHAEGHIPMKALGSKNPSAGDWVVDKYFVATQEEAELLDAPAFSFKQRVLAGLELAGQEADPEQVEEWLALGEEGLLSDEEDERLRKLAALAAEKLGLKILPVFERVEKEPEGWVELPFRPKEKIIRRQK